MKEKWYIKNIKEFLSEQYDKIIAAILTSILVILYYYFTGSDWKWEDIEPVKVTITTYAVSSAITFITSGALFYALRVYQGLHILFVQWLGMYKFYNDLKYFIWMSLNLFTVVILVPVIVAFINVVLTFFYNAYTFLLFTSPAVIIAGTIFGLLFLLQKLKKQELSGAKTNNIP